jgi:hypothetical protein
MHGLNKLKRENLGLPQKELPSFGTQRFQTGESKVNSGIDAVTNGLKKQPIKEAQRGLGMNKDSESIQTDTKDIKATIGLSESTYFGAIALIEQLLQKSNSLIEEFNRTVNVNTVSTGAGGGAGQGKGVDEPNQSMQLLKGYDRAVNNKIDDSIANSGVKGNQASSIQPGTGMTAREQTIGLTQPSTDMNANSKAATNQRAQEKWEKDMQGEQEQGAE